MSPRKEPVLLGTAGHIDHGKTRLVKALTGIDTDWLPEEKARGMTIDIGVAHLELDGRPVGVVDVPGHERFVRTMVAGAAGIDAALLVVAADDGVMPQTVEHFDILNLLGVGTAVVAINKVDLVDAEHRELVAAEVEELLQGSPLADSPRVFVSAATGEGLPELRRALEEAVRRARPRRRSPFFRLPIDRVFSIPGRGTVVTGSMLGGEVHVEDRVELLPARRELRVRGLQSHHQDRTSLGAGRRTAVNLAGIKKEEIHRGMELAAPGYLTPATCLDVELRYLRSAPRPLPSFAAVRLAIGTGEVLGRVVLLGEQRLRPGATALAQLRLRAPVVAEYGQPFILRDEAATRTLGGGRVLRPVAPRLRPAQAGAARAALQRLAREDEAERVNQVLADAGLGHLPPTVIAARAGVPPERVAPLVADLEGRGLLLRVPGHNRPVHREALDRLAGRILRVLGRFHRERPTAVGLPRRDLERLFHRRVPPALLAAAVARLLRDGRVVARLDRLALADFRPPMSEARRKLRERVREALLAGGFKPPTLRDLVGCFGGKATAIREVLEQAAADGEVVRITPEIYLPRETLVRLEEEVRTLYREAGPFPVTTLRERLGTSRKYIVPFCEYLDARGLTRREGDLRVLREEAPEAKEQKE